MRKLLSLTLMFLVATFWAKADHWTYEYGQHQYATIVFADIELHQETIGGGFEQLEFTANDYQSYEFAAFLNDELRGRAEVMAVPNAPMETYVLRFRVEGDESDNYEITFKAYDPAKQKEYNLVLASEPEFFSGDQTIGEPSHPLHLQLTLPVESIPVTSITSPFSTAYIACNVGDDLTPYFVDGLAFSVLPGDATNKAVNIELNEGSQSLVIDKAGNITASSSGISIIKVTSVDNPQISCLVLVNAYNDIKTVTVSPSTINVTYKDQAVEVSQEITNTVVLGEGQTTGGEMGLVSSAPDVLEINDQGAYAKKPGEADLTFSLPVVNRLMKTFDPNGNHTTYATATLHVVVVQGVTGLQVVWPNDLATGSEAMFTVTPLPAGAALNPDGLFTLSLAYSNMDINSMGSVTLTKNNESGTYTGSLTPAIPGMMTMTLAYDGMDGTQLNTTSEETEVGYTFTMNHGWQWRAIPYVDFALINDMTSVFGDELVELRTQSSQIYNDPVYGYFGDVGQLSQGQCFKLKMELYDAPKSYVFHGGNLYGLGAEPTMRKGWSYMPNPYVEPQYISEVFDAGMTFTDGDRIVSKDNGFVEYNTGKWVGDLTTLLPGEGYLFFNAGNNAIDLAFNQEFSPSSSRRMAPRQPRQRVWHYDASPFRDNMTIIAQINNQRVDNQYVVGAFVGDECRGEGHVVDGRLFITVHGNSGELVGFKLRNVITGETLDIEQAVRMQQMLGTVKKPFGMTTNDDTTTGIQNIGCERGTSERYDLSGRRIDSNRRGILLQRANDGTVRKGVMGK